MISVDHLPLRYSLGVNYIKHAGSENTDNSKGALTYISNYINKDKKISIIVLVISSTKKNKTVQERYDDFLNGYKGQRRGIKFIMSKEIIDNTEFNKIESEKVFDGRLVRTSTYVSFSDDIMYSFQFDDFGRNSNEIKSFLDRVKLSFM